jgi:hypothetical protein
MQAIIKLKITLSLVMTASLILSMSYLLIGQKFHEIIGTLLLILFILHNILNRGWYKSFARGRYGGVRLFQTVLNILTFISTLAAMISGIILSQNVFGFVSISGHTAFARALHLAAVYWAFAFIMMHLGLHWGMILGLIKRAFGQKDLPKKFIRGLRILGLLIAIMGARAFIKHNLYSYMFLRAQFAFFDLDQALPLFFAEYAAMMVMWGFLAHNLKRLINHNRGVVSAEK